MATRDFLMVRAWVHNSDDGLCGISLRIGLFPVDKQDQSEIIEQSINLVMSTNPLATTEMEIMMRNVMTSPIFWIFMMILYMVVYGGILGLIVSAFTKRTPDIFADDNDSEQNLNE